MAQKLMWTKKKSKNEQLLKCEHHKQKRDESD